MRVLLIVPTYRYKYEYPSFISLSDFPIGFAYLASALRHAGHQVFGLHPNNDATYRSAYEMVYDKLRRSLKEFYPELIGIGGLCTDFTFLKDVIHMLKELANDVPVVCGGGIINNDAEFIFTILKPDFCIIGDGEEGIVQLADMLEKGSRDYGHIPNLGYWKNGIPTFTENNFASIDINKRHFPDYEPFGIKKLLNDYSLVARYLYRYPKLYPRPMPIITARGCPFNCSFCVHKHNRLYRPRSLDNIFEEIALLYEQYQFNILLISDELFAVNTERMKEFCAILQERRKTQGWDFNWFFQSHASASLERDILKRSKEIGCYFFSYGLESASPRVLASMNKKIHPDQIAQAIRIADEIGLGFGCNFLFGDPAETEETIQVSMDFFSKHCANEYAYLTSVQPYPGSALFELCMKKGIIRDKKKFYETIDEQIWNMTTLPDSVWFSWAYMMLFITESMRWTKQTEAYFCRAEEAGDNPLVAQSGKLIYEIRAQCPHCGKEGHYRELIKGGRGLKDGALRGTAGRGISFLTDLLRNNSARIKLRLILKNLFFCLLHCRSPLFKSLKSLLPERVGDVSFITGCQHCHKRIWVILPNLEPESCFGSFLEKAAFNAIRILLR